MSILSSAVSSGLQIYLINAEQEMSCQLQPAGSALPAAPQEDAGLLCCRGASLPHAQLAVHQGKKHNKGVCIFLYQVKMNVQPS